MLTILSWIIFVPIIGWNIVLFMIIFEDYMKDGTLDLNPTNVKILVVSLVCLFVPGIYLFGIF